WPLTAARSSFASTTFFWIGTCREFRLGSAQSVLGGEWHRAPPFTSLGWPSFISSSENLMELQDRFQENCAFCKILLAKTDCHRVFEDEHALAFLDHRPLFPGHCLLIPKIHFQTLVDLPDSLL